MNCVLVRYSEIGLKSRHTRRSLEKALIGNIKLCLDANGAHFKGIWSRNGRIVITDFSGDVKCLGRVFGVASFSPANRVDADMDAINDAALKLYGDFSKGKKLSFRVSCRRVTKDISQTSVRINEIVGAYIVKKAGAGVKLEKPDIDIGIEILLKHAYVFNERFAGPAGLPLGSQGRVACIFDAKPETIASCYLMMKRGCSIIPVSSAKDKVIERFAEKIDEDWSYGSGFELEHVPGRGNMMARADAVAREYNCAAIVLGNDAKDLDKVRKMDNSIETIVIRPIVGYSRAEIKKICDMVLRV